MDAIAGSVNQIVFSGFALFRKNRWTTTLIQNDYLNIIYIIISHYIRQKEM